MMNLFQYFKYYIKKILIFYNFFYILNNNKINKK